MNIPISNRIVEAYVGEYASGKSENAVNRAIALMQAERTVSLVDLDVVEPFWTLRPLKSELSDLGIVVIAWDPAEAEGFGEAGTLLKPAARWALAREGEVVLDVGYGVDGAKVLGLVEGCLSNEDLRIIVVVNASRPMTGTVEDIVDHVRSLGRVDGMLNNTHLGDETEASVVQEGARMVAEASRILGIPVDATAAVQDMAVVIGPQDCMGNPVRPLKRFMHRGFW